MFFFTWIEFFFFIFSGSKSWEKGANGGVLVTCRDMLSHDTHIVTSRIWSHDRSRSSPNLEATLSFPGNQGNRELSHGFLNLTFTRALRKNVKKRLQKLNVEMVIGDHNESGESIGKFFFHKYVSEVCMSVAPCDVVVCLNPVRAIIKSLAAFGGKTQATYERGADSSVKGQEESFEKYDVEPILTSSNLPLLYADLACVRLFIPGEDKSVDIQETTKEHKTTMDHDMFLVQVFEFFLFQLT